MTAAPLTFNLQTFGQPALYAGESAGAGSERVLGPGKPLALLAYCCAVRDREHPREYLTALLWSDSESTRARQNLRQTMWRLRSVIGEAFHATDDAVTAISDAVRVDRDQFVAAVHGNDAATALAIYRGAFLAGLSIPGGDEFEDWAANERRHLEESLVRVVTQHARELAAHGRVASTRETLEELLRRTPENVDAHRIALELTLQIADGTTALSLADTLERRSRLHERETPAIQALIARARRAAPAEAHQAESLSLDLVGREEIFSKVMESWARARGGTTTAVSLTGAAGIGKTRLLTALAQRCRSKGATSVVAKANQGERDVALAFAAAIARSLASKPGAAGISAASARELVSLDPSLGSYFSTAPAGGDRADSVRTKALAILDLLGAICEHQPLALMLDDVHWVDAASRQLLSIIIARAAELPLMFVIAFRGSAQSIGGDAVMNFPLLPLRETEIVDAIRSTGRWPDAAEADAFVAALAQACEGVPLAIIERLGLARDRKLITHRDATWTSDNWAQATQAIAVAAPVDQRIGSCSAHERLVLLVIAVAGVPLAEPHLKRVLQEGSSAIETDGSAIVPLDVASALASLEVRGLTVRSHESWIPVHDVIAERVLELSTTDERRNIHVRLAQIVAEGEPAEASTAIRHYLIAEDDERAAREFRRVVKYQRSIGDPRSASEILKHIAGDRLSDKRSETILRAVPWLSRQGSVRARWIVGPLLAACIVLVIVLMAMSRRPQLLVSQAPITTDPVTNLSARILRTRPSVAISLSREAAPGQLKVRVKAADSGTRIIAGHDASVINGVALFNTLRFESQERVVRLRFEADGYAPTTLTVTNPITDDFKGINESARLFLVGGELNGQSLRPGTAKVVVTTGAMIDGFVQLEYSTYWPTSTVWLSMTPSWGDPKTSGVDVTPIMTPVRREITDTPVSLRAPAEAGRYWLIFMIDAEDSGGYLLSRTNWTVGHPIWQDGNEIALLPDSAIRRANTDGFTNTKVAYQRSWNTHSNGCEPLNVAGEVPLKLCPRPTGLFGIEVVVE